MTTQRSHQLIHPMRRLERWMQRTSDAGIGSTMMGGGVLFLAAAVALWYLTGR